jgi:alpha-glucuronidase
VDQGRSDWTSVYYHQADAAGIGFDRTASGSNALGQYAPRVIEQFADMASCPEPYLLWFHHVPWGRRLASGRTLWEELCHRYDAGSAATTRMRQTWSSLEGLIDAARFEHVSALLRVQEKEARWWRDACVLYFQTFSKLPLPESFAPPAEPLEFYRATEHRFVPGSKP